VETNADRIVLVEMLAHPRASDTLVV